MTCYVKNLFFKIKIVLIIDKKIIENAKKYWYRKLIDLISFSLHDWIFVLYN